MIVSFENLFLLDLVLNFRLFLLIVSKTIGLFEVKLLRLLDQLVNVKLESLGEHFVDHSNLVSIGVEVSQLILIFLIYLINIFFQFLCFLIYFISNLWLLRGILEFLGNTLCLALINLVLRCSWHHWLSCLHIHMIQHVLFLNLNICIWRLKLAHLWKNGFLILYCLGSILGNCHHGCISLGHHWIVNQSLIIHQLVYLHIWILNVLFLILQILITHFL